MNLDVVAIKDNLLALSTVWIVEGEHPRVRLRNTQYTPL